MEWDMVGWEGTEEQSVVGWISLFFQEGEGGLSRCPELAEAGMPRPGVLWSVPHPL